MSDSALDKRFCNCCGEFKQIYLVSRPGIYFCLKCAKPEHRNYWDEKKYKTGIGCKGF